MADLELGDLVFNTNKQQQYNCPEWVVALLRDIERTLCIVKYNLHQVEYDSPFGNTGNVFYNNVFEVQAYNWNDEIEQKYNFKCDDIEISWYKYLGRDTTINAEYTEKEIINMYNKCIESLRKMDKIGLEEIIKLYE